MEKLSRTKQIFLYVAPFPALAFFKIWAGKGPAPSQLLMIAALMLVYCGGVIWIARRWDKPTYFDWTIGIYFAFLTLCLLLFPASATALIREYSVSGIYGCLFAAAFFPPVLGKDPFTYHYAKKQTPQEFWDNPIFIRINRIMTFAWAGFSAMAFLLSLYPSLITRAVIPLALLLGGGLPFNIWFPDYYLKRLGLPSLALQRRMAQEGLLRSGPDPARTLPSSAWEAIAGMPDIFNTQGMRGQDALIGFEVTGTEEFHAYLNIRAGTCKLANSAVRKPDLLINTPADVWLGIARGEISGQEAFMKRQYHAEGDLSLLIRMGQIFGGQSPSDRGNGVQTNDHQAPDSFKEKTTNTAHASARNEREGTMKVLALSCSPRGEGQSKSTLMLSHLVEGMRAADAEVEVVDLRKKTVKNCIGCFTCWTKTPGVCIHKDDMTNELFPKWLEADLVVYATPLYHFLMNATMKAFLERTLPVLQPFFEEREGRTHHPLRHKHPRFAILCVAGFPEEAVFDQLSYWVQSVYGQHGLVAVEIYRAGAELLTVPACGQKAQAVLEATKRAGRELVETGGVSAETMTDIKQEIVEDRDAWNKMGNLMWRTSIAEGVTPGEFQERGMVPRPDSIETFLLIMPMGFNPEGAGDTEAVLQFNFTAEVEGSCYLEIKNREISAFEGRADGPTLTIDAPFEVWMDIVTGKVDGQQAFMEGKYKVVGDLALLMRMNQLFGKS